MVRRISSDRSLEGAPTQPKGDVNNVPHRQENAPTGFIKGGPDMAGLFTIEHSLVGERPAPMDGSTLYLKPRLEAAGTRRTDRTKLAHGDVREE